MKPKNRLKQIIKENIKSIILESQESKSIDAAKKLAMQHGYSYEEADKLVRHDIRHDFPFFSRNKRGNKFILGVTRMFLDGQLRDASEINALNTTLKYVASDAHYDEYDRNLNGMSAQDLIQRFAKNVEMDMEKDRNEVNSMQFDKGQSQYDIVRIDSFEQACEYNKYTYENSQWCLTYSRTNYNSYTCNGLNQLYFCLRKGFENVEPMPSEGCPLDNYGLSMISVIVNENGALAFCTSRWNHANGGNDSIMNTKQISKVIGQNFYKVFKPNNKWKEILGNALRRLKNGEKPSDVFDDYDYSCLWPGRVRFNGKWNYLKQDKKSLLSPDLWFDWCGDFMNGFGVVELNGKYNFIRKDGSLLSPNQWFDFCAYFLEGFAKVELNGEQNLIDGEGNLLSPYQWFDWCGDFWRGYACVELKGENYKIDAEGNLYDSKTEEPLGININNMNTQNESINRNKRINKMKDMINETIKKVLHEGDIDGTVKKTGVTFTPSDAQQAALDILRNAEREERAKTDEKFNFGWYEDRLEKPVEKLLKRFNKVYKPKIDLVQDQTGRYDKQLPRPSQWSSQNREIRLFKIHYDIDVDKKGITLTRTLSGDIDYTCVYRLMPGDPNNDIFNLPRQLEIDKKLVQYAQNPNKNHSFWNDLNPYKVVREGKIIGGGKKVVRLTETDLHNIIKESVNRIINLL